MSFGDTVIDEQFPTAHFPSLSMICGLLANAAGLCRSRPEEIQNLQSSMEIASRIDRVGHRLRDYQTALLDSRDVAWTSSGRVAGRDGGAAGPFTVQIEKEYWSDAAVTVAVSLPACRIDAIMSALREPARVLFLGRASCPPSRPILAGAINVENVLQAIEQWPTDDGCPATMAAQWPAYLGLERQSNVALIADRKDWQNRVHVGSRQVREAPVEVGTST